MLNYSSNFKINIKDTPKNYILPNTNTRGSLPNRIVCKHSILMLLMFHSSCTLSSWRDRSNVQTKYLSFFFKPSQTKYFTLLRAPYRYKIARNQISFKRFFLKCSIVLFVNSSCSALELTHSYKHLFTISSSLSSLYTDLDTNMCKQNNILLSVPFMYSNYFLIKNYR